MKVLLIVVAILLIFILIVVGISKKDQVSEWSIKHRSGLQFFGFLCFIGFVIWAIKKFLFDNLRKEYHWN